MDDRRFSDEEVREILARAVEARSSRALTSSDGLSLAELKEIGQEAGIEPARVEDAARAVVRRRSEGGGRFLGAPTKLEVERSVKGSLEGISSAELRSTVRRTMGQQGDFDEGEGFLEWSASSDVGFRFVSLTEREGRVSISGSVNLGNLKVAMGLPAGIVGTIFTVLSFVGAAKQESTIALVLGFLILPVLYTVVRTIFGNVARSQAAKLEQTADDLARLTGGNE